MPYQFAMYIFCCCVSFVAVVYRLFSACIQCVWCLENGWDVYQVQTVRTIFPLPASVVSDFFGLNLVHYRIISFTYTLKFHF